MKFSINDFSHRRHRGLVALLALSLAALFCNPAHAGLSFGGYSWTWSSTSDNGKYIFVQLFPEPLAEQIAKIHNCGEDPPYYTIAKEEAEVRHLLATYSQSGMYRNDGSTTPLWVPIEPVWAGTPSPDGTKIAFLNPDYHQGIDLYEPNTPCRNFTEAQIMGYPVFFLWLYSDFKLTSTGWRISGTLRC